MFSSTSGGRLRGLTVMLAAGAVALTVGAAQAEDDTFNMSLDLARAYLEIGDQEGAKDMLNQALASSRDPGHRRQIEELLKQID